MDKPEPHAAIGMMKAAFENLAGKGNWGEFHSLQQLVGSGAFTEAEMQELKELAQETIRTAKKDKIVEELLKWTHAGGKIHKAVQAVSDVGPHNKMPPGNTFVPDESFLRALERQKYEHDRQKQSQNYGQQPPKSILNPDKFWP